MMQNSLRRLLIFLLITSLVAVVSYMEIYLLLFDSKYKTVTSMDTKYSVATNYERKDWHDWKFIKYEKSRQGPGEQGEPFYLTDPEDIALNEELYKIEGLYALVSDRISVNRSVPDTRLPICKTIKYLKSLPTTSVIVIFYNEYFSILCRTIHSIYNRTPHELLHEILLVNDASTKTELYERLQKYITENFDGRVKIINNQNRKGLIVARMEGARRATGDVLVFLDSHMEANVNWLPPLLEPIAIDPLTSTVPIIDNFFHDTFAYGSGGDGSRGVFDWNLEFHWLPRRPEDKIHPEKPAPQPVMLGCAFAIRRDYFFDLGAYDEQFMIWNGENMELSFKLWMCGGKLLEVPCSRIAHTFRRHNEWRNLPGVDFVGYNFKRLVEVWLDDYKQYFYRKDPERFARIDPGDLTREKAIRKNLNCKPFSYFLEYVMPDMLERYPFADPGVFASGAIQSLANKSLCIDILNRPAGEPLGLYDCHSDLVNPGYNQYFKLSWHRVIKMNNSNDECLDMYMTSIVGCHYELGHQMWRHDLNTHQIINPPNDCLTAETASRTLTVKPCEAGDDTQMWHWGFTNVTALTNWETFGVKLPK